MVDETWLMIDFPLLCGIVEVEQEQAPMTMIDGNKVMQRANLALEPDELTRAVHRLKGGGFIDVTEKRLGGGGVIWTIFGVNERGRRVSGQWPPDDAYLSLLQVLQTQIEDAPDEPTKTKLRAALEGLVGVGRDIGVDVVAAWLSRMS